MEEKIDVLNGKGKKTGKVENKSQIHANGSWHLSVHVWLINRQGELLLQRRSKEKINYPNILDVSVAGHSSSGEISCQSAIREVREEIGLEIGNKQLKKIGSVVQKTILNNGTYFDNEFNDIYVIKTNVKISEMRRQMDEVDELFYLDWKELRKRIKEKQKDIVPHPNEYNLLFLYLKNGGY